MATRSSMERLTDGKVRVNIQHSSLLHAWVYIQCRAHVEAISTLRFPDEEPHSAGEDGCISLEYLP